MKKVFLLALVGGAFAMTSCKKDYTCDCTVSGVNIPLEFKDAKKKDATDACDQAESTYKIADSGASCTLK